MGYSCAAPIQSPKARDRMFAFLEKTYRDWAVVCGTERDYPRSVCHDGQLAYDHGKNRIGFNYRSLGDEDHYIFSLLRWIALRVGRKRVFKKLSPVAVPYIVYDGHEAWPTLLKDTWKDAPEDFRWYLVDEHGFQRADRPWDNWVDDDITRNRNHPYIVQREAQYVEIDKLVATELARLSKLWEEYPE